MNEEEKEAIEYIKSELNINDFMSRLVFMRDDIELVLNLIEKQQKEIEKRLKEIDSLYKMMSAKDDEIKYLEGKLEQYGEEYQILKDDIEGHRIAYVDTPEFEENYISKDEIRHIRDKAECMDYYSLNDVIDDLSKLLGE